MKGDKITSEFEHVELPYLKESENSGVEIVSGFEDILGHLNNKFGLEAKTDEENEKYKSVLADCMKLFQKTEKLVYDIAHFDEKRRDFNRNAMDFLKKIDDQLKHENGSTGSRLNGVDFYVFYLVNLVSSMIQGCLQSFKFITRFQARIMKNWGIQEYQRAMVRQKFPFFDQDAIWGSFNKMGPVLSTPMAPYATE